MAPAKEGGLGWLVALAGLGILAAGAFVALGGLPLLKGGDGVARELDVPSAAMNQAGPAQGVDVAAALTARAAIEAADAAAERMRIVEGGRLVLDLDDHPRDMPLRFALDLSDEARGHADRAVTVVSEHGARIDAVARALPGAGSGVLLEVDPSALGSGRYLIQIETVETSHPFRIRRYVLEVD